MSTFDQQQFIQDCLVANASGQADLREVVAAAVSQPTAIVAGLGEPQKAGVSTLYHSPDLTIINFVWAPYMNLMPHNHNMSAIIGIYAGREDNIFWKRNKNSIEAVAAKTLGTGEVATLGTHIIHSVANPIGKLTSAIHVYRGDFFEPKEARSEWEHEALEERPWQIENVRQCFADADARYNLWQETITAHD